MVFPKARLTVSACLFIAWIGFLVYLVARTRDPVILSRPQLQVSSLVIVADVRGENRPEPSVMVKTVVWTLAEEDAKLANGNLTVDGLAACGHEHGWAGPGEYIIPLTKRTLDNGHAYEVTALPLSPGYYPKFVTIELVNVGPDKEKVEKLVGELSHGTVQKGELKPGILARNVRRQEAEEIQQKLEAAKARVRLRDGEFRIYRATPDAMEQLKK